MLDQHKDPPYTMIFLSTSNKCGRKQHNQQLSSWVGHHSCRNLQSLLLSSIQTVGFPQNHLSTSLQEYSKNGNCLFRKTVTLSEGYDNQIKIPYNLPLKKKKQYQTSSPSSEILTTVSGSFSYTAKSYAIKHKFTDHFSLS